MKHAVSLLLALAVLWILLSGHFEPFLLGLGALSVAFVAWLSHRMEVVDHESHPLHLSRKLFTYWPWLLKEIVKANIDVTKCVFGPSKNIKPVVFDAPASQQSDVGRVIHANSITLTPGTVSLHVGSERITVHALTPELADGLVSGGMDKRVPDAGDPS